MGKDKKSFSQSASENWADFRKFLYDGDNGTVLGRSGRSWIKICIFYAFYYGFLAILFASALAIVRGSLDEYTPYYQTRLQTPGVVIQPKVPSNLEQTGDIRYNYYPGNPEKQANDVEYDRLVKQIERFLYDYAPENQTAEYGFQECAVDGQMTGNQELEPGQTVPACAFYKNLLGPCGTYPYGYDEGKPCLYIKLNRIIHWTPVTYKNLSNADYFPTSNAPPLADLLADYGLKFKPYLMYGACFGYEEKDENFLSQGNRKNNKYYPHYMGLPLVYYPYLGSRRQLNYTNPLIAVQLTNVTKNEKIDVVCKVYALNIEDNREMGEGYFRFDMMISTPSS